MYAEQVDTTYRTYPAAQHFTSNQLLITIMFYSLCKCVGTTHSCTNANLLFLQHYTHQTNLSGWRLLLLLTYYIMHTYRHTVCTSQQSRLVHVNNHLPTKRNVFLYVITIHKQFYDFRNFRKFLVKKDFVNLRSEVGG